MRSRGRRFGFLSGLLRPASLLRLPRVVRYVVPVVAAALVYAIQTYLLPAQGGAPFVLFYMGIALSAWLGGFLPGLLAVGISAALANYAFTGAPGWSVSSHELTLTTLFLVSASVVVALCAGFRGATIRAQQQAEERARVRDAVSGKEQRLRAIFENVALGIVEGDEEGHVRNTNQRFCDMLGYTREELLGRSAHELTAPEDRPRARELNDRLIRGEINRYDYDKRYLAKDGTPVWVHVTVSPIRDASGATPRVVATVEDISELRRAKHRIEESDRHKSEFLAVLSHELRNPLTPISNSLHILRCVPPDGPHAKRAHQVIERQVLHLTRLIDDLLDVTRIARGKIRIQRERVELCSLVLQSAEDHRPLFAAAQVQLETRPCHGHLYTEGDPTRLSEIVGNLLTNAAKFTPRGGLVELWVAREDGAAAVHVRDNGVGIPASLLANLFEPFVQADATLARSQGGLGLGLALVKGLVQLHGGAVTARSQGLGKGAEFVVRLPVEPPGQAAQQPGPLVAASPAHRGLNVLVIEDNVDAAESLKEALELSRPRVQIATSGMDGIEKAHASRPDVVLCDIGLPGMNGFEVARHMRADPHLRACHLVALSGYAAPEDVEKARQAGFAQHLAKPPDIDRIEQTLSTIRAEGVKGATVPR